jgi:N-acyl-L-homoserine lactone synthetase
VTPASLSLQFDVQGELRAAARECEAEVFSARFGNSAQDLVDAYGAYESASHFLTVTDDAGHVVAAARLIFPSQAGLKTLDDVAHEPWRMDPRRAAGTAGLDVRRTVDATTFSVRPGESNRSFQASYALLYGLFMGMQANDILSMVAVIDDPVRKMLRAAGLIFHRLPGTTAQPYFGSASSEPVYAHLAHLMTTQRALNPRAHDAMAKGIGLDVTVPPIRELKLQPARVIDLTKSEQTAPEHV